MEIIIAPSLLAADFSHLAQEIKDVEAGGADWLHCDVMDGHFVPNITFGPFIVKAIKKIASVPLDVHIMISNPAKYAGEFCQAGADILTFHIEAASDPGEVIRIIRDHNVKAAVAISPDTPAKAVDKILDQVDMVLVMTVHPGFGGQSFIEPCLDKVRSIRQAAGTRIDIQVDGGLTPETVTAAAAAGANAIVAGTAVFKAGDIASVITGMRHSAAKHLWSG
ncbi:ribulose-phosphate 3-epimerase [Planctomycetota bacterium]